MHETQFNHLLAQSSGLSQSQKSESMVRAESSSWESEMRVRAEGQSRESEMRVRARVRAESQSWETELRVRAKCQSQESAPWVRDESQSQELKPGVRVTSQLRVSVTSQSQESELGVRAKSQSRESELRVRAETMKYYWTFVMGLKFERWKIFAEDHRATGQNTVSESQINLLPWKWPPTMSVFNSGPPFLINILFYQHPDRRSYYINRHIQTRFTEQRI